MTGQRFHDLRSSASSRTVAIEPHWDHLPSDDLALGAFAHNETERLQPELIGVQPPTCATVPEVPNVNDLESIWDRFVVLHGYKPFAKADQQHGRKPGGVRIGALAGRTFRPGVQIATAPQVLSNQT
jgi:hypothetical protein